MLGQRRRRRSTLAQHWANILCVLGMLGLRHSTSQQKKVDLGRFNVGHHLHRWHNINPIVSQRLVLYGKDC